MIFNKNFRQLYPLFLLAITISILVCFSGDHTTTAYPSNTDPTYETAIEDESTPAEWIPVITEPVSTEPPPTPTEPALTDPAPTEPDAAIPSEPVHTHTYSKTVIQPTETKKGYTLCKCECGHSYKTNYTAALSPNLGSSQKPSLSIPDEMLNSNVLQSLEYLGVNVQTLKDSGVLFNTGYIASRTPSYAKSPVPYSRKGIGSGQQTVTDSTTPTGFAPDVAKFRQTGLDCVDFAAYYLTNYLPNIKGADISILQEMNDKYKSKFGRCYDHMDFWPKACSDLAEQGKIEMYTYKVGEDYSDVFDKIQPGALIQMGDKKDATKHYAIYAGTYNGKHFIIHSGNVNRGPEISLINYMWDDGQTAWPVAFYEFHFPSAIGTG